MAVRLTGVKVRDARLMRQEEVEKRYTILPVKDLECGMVNCEVV